MTTEVTVKYDIDRSTLPPHTDAEFEEWVRWETQLNGSIRNDNPLNGQDLDPNMKAYMTWDEY